MWYFFSLWKWVFLPSVPWQTWRFMWRQAQRALHIWQASLYSVTNAYSFCAFWEILSTCLAFNLTWISWLSTNFICGLQNKLILSRSLMKMGDLHFTLWQKCILLRLQKTNQSLSLFDSSYASLSLRSGLYIAALLTPSCGIPLYKVKSSSYHTTQSSQWRTHPPK